MRACERYRTYDGRAARRGIRLKVFLATLRIPPRTPMCLAVSRGYLCGERVGENVGARMRMRLHNHIRPPRSRASWEQLVVPQCLVCVCAAAQAVHFTWRDEGFGKEHPSEIVESDEPGAGRLERCRSWGGCRLCASAGLHRDLAQALVLAQARAHCSSASSPGAPAASRRCARKHVDPTAPIGCSAFLLSPG